MDIQICQSCGVILRGKSKFCTGCGVTVSKFSPTVLPPISQSATPLAVKLEPDPLVLERAMTRANQGRSATGNGSSASGYGSSGSGNADYSRGGFVAENPAAANEYLTSTYEPPEPAIERFYGHELDSQSAQAAEDKSQDSPTGSESSTLSKLQNILGGAAKTSSTSSQGMSDLISLDSSSDEPDVAPESSSENEYDFVPSSTFAAVSSNGDYGNIDSTFDPASGASLDESFEPPLSRSPETYSSSESSIQPPVSPTPVGVAATGPAVTADRALATTFHDASYTRTPLSANRLFPSSAPNMVTAEALAGDTSPRPMGASTLDSNVISAAKDTSRPSNGGASSQGAFFAGAAPSSTEGSRENSITSTSQMAANTSFFDNAPRSHAPADAEREAPTPAGPPLSAVPQSLVADFKEQPAAAASTNESSAPDTAPTAAPTNAPSTAPASPSPNPANSNGSFSSPAGAQTFDFFAASRPGTKTQSNEGNRLTVKEEAPSAPAEQAAAKPTVDIDIPAGTPSIIAQALRAAAQTESSTDNRSLKNDSEKQSDSAKKSLGDNADSRDGDSQKEQSKSKSSDEDEPRSRRGYNRFRESERESSKGNDESSDKSNKEEPKTIKIGKFELPLSKQVLTIGVLVIFLGLPLCAIVMNLLGSAVSGGGSSGQSTALAGTWQFGSTDSHGRSFSGQCWMDQMGGTISGRGVDKFGNFAIINGQYVYPDVQFEKIYIDQQNHAIGKPYTFKGRVDWINPEPGKGQFNMHMYGAWMVSARSGMGWRGHPVTLQGKWEAGMTEIAQPKAGPDGKLVDMRQPTNPIGNLFAMIFAYPVNGDPKGWPQFFLRIAILLGAIGVGAVFLSQKLLGPAGLVNIWSKKVYIPSQYKSQWSKMLKEYGKPLRPGGLPLGLRADWNLMNFYMPRTLNLTPEARLANPHMLVLGSGQKGKSRLMGSMIVHDIQSNDRAVVVIDSDGGLIDHVMSWIAAHPKGSDIAKRVVIVDPTHGSEALAYNPLEFPDDGDLQNAASAVVFGFKAIYTEPPGSQSQWNQQTANILRNSAILLIANGRTLTDLPVLLSENDFRDVLLERVERMKNERPEYTTLLEAWAQYKRLARTDQWITWVEPILNRVQPMLGDPRIRPILTKTKGDLNLKEIISEGKILLVKVPQGQLDQNASLLGSLLVTGLKQAALSLSLKSGSRKHTCALYLDELDNFIEKETYDAITSETKKFQIGFVGASKSLQDLPEDYRNKIISNVGTMCCFSLVKKDGDLLGPQMFRVDGRRIKHQTLQNIFNKVNTSPQFELISDEEKLNIDRVVGQENRTYFCYRVGTIAGVFQMKSPDFNDIPDKDINWTLIDQIYARSLPSH